MWMILSNVHPANVKKYEDIVTIMLLLCLFGRSGVGEVHKYDGHSYV